MIRRDCRKGFSLVELLVVVAITGVLALAGFAAYTHYINQAKDEAVLADGQEIHRAIERDHFVVRSGIGSGGFISGLSVENTCLELLDKLGESLSVTANTNPFNGFALVQNAVPAPALGSSAELERGAIYISCLHPNARISDTNFYLQTCICTESTCPLTELPSSDQLLNRDICYRL